MYAQGQEVLMRTLRNYAGRQDITFTEDEWTDASNVSRGSTTEISKKRGLI